MTKRYNMEDVTDVALFDKNTGEEVMKLDSARLVYTPAKASSFTMPTQHEIDFDKVNTLDDMKTILKSLRFGIYSHSPQFEEMKPFLKGVDNE